jgi:hypothetical protein
MSEKEVSLSISSLQTSADSRSVSSDPLSCQHILLWECVAANCSLPDHIWQHPYESISILSFHIVRNYEMYKNDGWPGSTDDASTTSRMSQRLTTRQWLRQRVTVLQGIDTLQSSLGALSRVFYQMAQKNYTAEEELKIGPFGKRRKIENVRMWGDWKPGSSDTVGRHGPENMSNYEGGETLTLLSRLR